MFGVGGGDVGIEGLQGSKEDVVVDKELTYGKDEDKGGVKVEVINVDKMEVIGKDEIMEFSSYKGSGIESHRKMKRGSVAKKRKAKTKRHMKWLGMGEN